MRILLVLVHYFRGEPDSRYSSTKASLREERHLAVRTAIESWRGHFGTITQQNYRIGQSEIRQGLGDELHIVALVNGNNHLLDEEFCRQHRVNVLDVAVENPRMLGFHAQKVFADTRYGYDLFMFSEDDLRLPDGNFLWRVLAFQEAFGWRRLLLPNRYEWNRNGNTLKTFIDGDVPREWIEQYERSLPDEPFLRQHFPGRTVVYQRATNPHSGFFALTSEQLQYWMQQPHFLDMDCSFESPLASAATLGPLKTFSIYKSFGRDAGWFEIEHLDKKFSDKNRAEITGNK